MRIQYQCSFCSQSYDWYEGVYENEKYDWHKAHKKGTEYNEQPGPYIGANAIKLTRFAPSPERYGDALESDEKNLGNLKNVVINLCPSCMRKLLKDCHPDNDNGNCFNVV